eukprot:scaffold83937_cov66-Phaeocystis_antarctica.AAC.4
MVSAVRLLLRTAKAPPSAERVNRVAPGPSVTRDSRPSPALTVSEDTLSPPLGETPAPSSSIATSGSSIGTSGVLRAKLSGRKYMRKYKDMMTEYWLGKPATIASASSLPLPVGLPIATSAVPTDRRQVRLPQAPKLTREGAS